MSEKVMEQQNEKKNTRKVGNKSRTTLHSYTTYIIAMF